MLRPTKKAKSRAQSTGESRQNVRGRTARPSGLKKRSTRIFTLLLAVLMLMGLLPTAALAADQTTIGTQDTSNLFEYHNDSGWHDLKTPQHWDRTTGDVAYCLEHEKDSPPSNETYTAFNPDAVYGTTTLNGIKAILSNGYPVKNGGLSDSAARYATANALRAWLKESAGIGYNFMNVANGNVRAKSGQESTWNFMMSLLTKARNGAVSNVGGTVSASPNPANWSLVNGQLQTSVNVTSSAGYTITSTPNGVNVSGYSGGGSDTLKLTAPLSMANQALTMKLKGAAGDDTAALYWYEPQHGTYQPLVVTEIVPGTDGQEASVTIKGEFYHLTVNKKDTHTGSAIDGAVFELRHNGSPVSLTKTANGKYMPGSGSAQFTTNGGKAVIEYLPAASGYQVVEVSTPDPGYIASGAISVSMNANKEITVENKPTELHIQKKDKLTGDAMPAIEFRVKNSSGQIVKLAKVKDGEYKPSSSGSETFKLDATGQAHIYYLPPSAYTIEELPLTGYADLAPQKVTVGASPTTVKIDNDPLTFRLIKTDDYTGEPMQGVKFSIYDGSGNLIKLASMGNGAYKPASNGNATFETAADGSATIYYLPKGNYTIREAEPVPSYAIPDDSDIVINGGNGMGNPVRIGVENEPLTLEFEKTDALTGKYLDGAVFRLLDEQGQIVKLTKERNGEYKPAADGEETFTTSGGKTIIRYLTVQKYTIEEVSAPPAFMPDDAKSFTMTWQNGTSNPIEQDMEDEPLTLEFTKLDSFTGLPMDGAVFKLLDADGNVVKLSPFEGKDGYFVVDPNGKETWTTKDGKATIYYLPVSTYTVVEHKAADTYAPALDRKVNITLQNGFSNPARLSMRDEPLMLEVRKKDSVSGQPIGGVQFRLEDEDGNVIKLSPIEGRNGYFKPDENGAETFLIPSTGIAKILYLPYQVYQVIEEKSAAGFALSSEAAIITMRQTNSISDPARVDVFNTPLELELFKVDKLTGDPVDGAVFRLLNADGDVIKLAKQQDGSYKPDDKGAETFIANGGKAKVRYIPAGKYTIEELECAGYGIAAPQEVEVTIENSAENPAQTTVENIPLEFEIIKTDKTNGELLDGVSFRLLDENGDVVRLAKQKDGNYKPDDKGQDTFCTTEGKATVQYVHPGKYTIEEQENASYDIAAPQELEITTAHVNGSHAVLEFENIPTELVIEKQDATNNQPLVGATFRLLDQDGKAILLSKEKDGSYRPDADGDEVIELDESAQARITHLPAQKLAIEELTAPVGFGLADKLELELTTEHTMEAPLKAVVQDNPLALRIIKIHGKTQKPLSGAGFVIKQKDNLDTAITFTLEDSVYRYDPDGKETTIMVDDNGEALVYGIPASDYVLEETVVPDNFFPAPAQNFTIGVDNVLENIVEVKVINEPSVKLGIDSDKYNVFIAIGLCLAGVGFAAWQIIRRRRKGLAE